MNKVNDGGPAFPNVPDGAGTQWDNWDSGMTLRDYFAAKAMSVVWENIPEDANREMSLDYLGKYSYQMADAMIKAREI